MPTPTMLCKLCEKIAISVQRPSEQREILEPVWSYDFAQRNTQCSTCQHLSEAFKNRQGWSSRCNCLDQSCEPDWKVCIQFNTGYDCWMMILSPCGGRCEDYLYNPTLLMVQILKEPDIKEGVAVAIGQQSIDLGRIKRRMDTCDASHAGFCHSLVQPYEKVERATNLHFIDVERRCLVDQPNQECQYLALSYVWGPAINPFQTLISNYSQLSKDGAFDLPANRARLPKTIQDSMLLTRSLGIKYIWIDRFCIIQDDIAAKPSQLAAKASIYANAYFTIAASEGEDGDFGLPGLSSSSPRQPPYCEFQFTPECHMVERNPTLSADSWDGARYHTRGWTLQEYVLSRRILVFHHQTVSWVCQVDSVQENGVEPQERAVPNLRTNFLHSLIWTSWPNIRSYANMVETYSRRELTNQDDALNAFDAFITVQGRPMEGDSYNSTPHHRFLQSTQTWKRCK
ncbi:heterokaryon incompatibility protein-domain-containing protein [Pyrenochaeta sp. MPI-SDFR-AT-0127]|nr:heterokaryon incompatibility protein-domain-containing protein [Pyrenochaeta sp. MPI-SDFR-AT-0127]